MWRLAKSLELLRSQVNAAYPNRSKTHDGTIGDTAHSARASDHNPNAANVVTAIDITNDPAHGLSARALAERLLASRDPRIKYIISNAQIASSTVSPWKWRPYTGTNAHRAHVHISVVADPGLYDNQKPWAVGAAAADHPPPLPAYRSLIGGFYSSPADSAKYKPSIWSNNPGAVNGANKTGAKVEWVQAFQGFVKTHVIGGGNPIAVFETPEQGVALWWTLVKRYRTASIWNPPVDTVQGIVNRYGGGQDYSAYVKYVCDRTGFAPGKVIDLNDDSVLVTFAKAMFRYEAGVETPLSDAQLKYGFGLARGKVTAPPPTKSMSPAAATIGAGVGGVGAVVAFGTWIAANPVHTAMFAVGVVLIVAAILYSLRKK